MDQAKIDQIKARAEHGELIPGRDILALIERLGATERSRDGAIKQIGLYSRKVVSLDAENEQRGRALRWIWENYGEFYMPDWVEKLMAESGVQSEKKNGLA